LYKPTFCLLLLLLLLLFLLSGLDYKLQFMEMVVDDHMASCWVDLNIKLAPFYIKRYHMPTVVMLRFRRCEDGL
jgi:hypothetical protein